MRKTYEQPLLHDWTLPEEEILPPDKNTLFSGSTFHQVLPTN
jgi:hypothetical protein